MNIEWVVEYLFSAREFLGELFVANLGALQLVSLLISAALFAGIVYLIAKLNLVGMGMEKLSEVIAKKDLSRRRSVRAWQRVEQRILMDDEAQVKLAVIEADKILDEILKMAGLRGEAMADRLKKLTPAQLSNIENVWQVHKIRNRIVHEPDYHLAHADAAYAIDIYRVALKELGLID
ncbi:MAG: hypothetical protein A2128_02200 [Candidatus Liptonbacteria bacterium GWC1_60_9]|uniref:DUF4145 domain-containing protein n=3 Tax=Candidatus Liptoniibacteriota TaxID=1817909 RepID=A0A1G2CJG2_9BACT|nr:MAG: hypothetical protein UZ00_C0008G0017 [Parcubacteria group bacterium GW2011_GWA1_60_11]OGY96900.1 MAG: hypothetical protein A2128_02200 [Candidatus Liptonbacteria bacterium GWC1_60_9]OGZ00078.1 MAG: hypothetical protein A3E09_02820 [Candidatus Liptonbacteria bacterium RIFCSPHIGHO2_12_FULL_60_13]OGZ01543.1 MAG: hypothetical protein A3G64_00220 [Candidatus Liptonbacteria bacterium RIFCSPLOWO2_12_FULL_60_15]